MSTSERLDGTLVTVFPALASNQVRSVRSPTWHSKGNRWAPRWASSRTPSRPNPGTPSKTSQFRICFHACAVSTMQQSPESHVDISAGIQATNDWQLVGASFLDHVSESAQRFASYKGRELHPALLTRSHCLTLAFENPRPSFIEIIERTVLRPVEADHQRLTTLPRGDDADFVTAPDGIPLSLMVWVWPSIFNWGAVDKRLTTQLPVRRRALSATSACRRRSGQRERWTRKLPSGGGGADGARTIASFTDVSRGGGQRSMPGHRQVSR
jgi:hypothetical protein